MPLSDRDLAALADAKVVAMITTGADGYPKAVRVGLAVVDGNLWSSGTRDRARTRRLRKDPRCTLFVTGSGFGYLSLETTVTILDGPDVADESVGMFRVMQGRPTGPLNWFGSELSEEELRQRMVEEGRIIYQFEVQRSQGISA